MKPIDHSVFPEGSLCRMMVAEIYANGQTEDATFLHDGDFPSPPVRLKLNKASGDLFFCLENGEIIPYGEKIKPEIVKILDALPALALHNMDRKTQQVRNSLLIPIETI